MFQLLSFIILNNYILLCMINIQQLNIYYIKLKAAQNKRKKQMGVEIF